MEDQTLTQAILQAMVDLCNHATDTVWISSSETMFNRLETLYIESGGTHSKLEQIYPEYCGSRIR